MRARRVFRSAEALSPVEKNVIYITAILHMVSRVSEVKPVADVYAFRIDVIRRAGELRACVFQRVLSSRSSLTANKMRILLVANLYRPFVVGGAEIVVEHLAHGLQAAGADV